MFQPLSVTQHPVHVGIFLIIRGPASKYPTATFSMDTTCPPHRSKWIFVEETERCLAQLQGKDQSRTASRNQLSRSAKRIGDDFIDMCQPGWEFAI